MLTSSTLPIRYRVVGGYVEPADRSSGRQRVTAGEYVYDPRTGTLGDLRLWWGDAGYAFAVRERPGLVRGTDGRYWGEGVGIWPGGRRSTCRVEEGVLVANEHGRTLDARWWEGEGGELWYLHLEAEPDA